MVLKDSITTATHSWKVVSIQVGNQMPGFTIQIRSDGNYNQEWFSTVLDSFELDNCNSGKTNSNGTITFDKLNCNFDNDMCNWLVVSSPKLQTSWYRTNSFYIEPGHDHTSMNASSFARGSWLTTKTPLSYASAAQAVLINEKPINPTKHPICMSFWYYYFGSKVDYFSVAISNTTLSYNQTTLWLRSIPEERNWRQAFVEIPAQDKPFYVTFIASVFPATVVGIDDVKFDDAACSNNNIGFCDFEVNTCSWTSSGTTKINRVEGTNDEKIPDHTTGTISGHFMSANRTGTAKLQIPLYNFPYLQSSLQPVLHGRRPHRINPVKTICLKFHYYFLLQSKKFGLDNSMLVKSVWYSQSTSSDPINGSFLINYNQSNQWNYFTQSFKVSKFYSLEIDTTIMSPSSQILFDDISIRENGCEEQGNCDFEQGNDSFEFKVVF